MSAGTLTLTNNSDIVTGIGTSFATELDAGTSLQRHCNRWRSGNYGSDLRCA